MHPAGHVGDIWCRMWRYLSWTPPPTDSKYLTMRWWPWWRHHLRVRQVPRAPFMAWLPEHCGVDRVSVLYASSDIMDARLPARRRRGALAPTDRRRRALPAARPCVPLVVPRPAGGRAAAAAPPGAGRRAEGGAPARAGRVGAPHHAARLRGHHVPPARGGARRGGGHLLLGEW